MPSTKQRIGVMIRQTKGRRVGSKSMQDICTGMLGLWTAPFKPTLPRGNLFIVWSKNLLMTKMPGCVTSCRLDGFFCSNLIHLCWSNISGSSENGRKQGKWPGGGPDWLVECWVCLPETKPSCLWIGDHPDSIVYLSIVRIIYHSFQKRKHNPLQLMSLSLLIPFKI